LELKHKDFPGLNKFEELELRSMLNDMLIETVQPSRCNRRSVDKPKKKFRKIFGLTDEENYRLSVILDETL